MKSTKKKYRRLDYLCSTHFLSSPSTWINNKGENVFSLDKQIQQYKEYNQSKRTIEYLEMFSLFKELKFSDIEALKYSHDKYLEHKFRNRIYETKPIRERKDNRHPETYGRNYGSGPQGYTIRIPSLKRKGQWKRFRQLFPKEYVHIPEYLNKKLPDNLK